MTSTATALISAVSMRRAVQPPADQCRQGDQQHGRHEHLADFIHQFLDRRFRRLGVFDQTNDPRQHGFRAEGGGAHQQAAFTVDRAAGDVVARLFRHRQAFAADQGFVGVALAFDALRRRPGSVRRV